MRGGSIVGAVLLVALIGAAAVVIDAGSKVVPNAQVAAVTSPTNPPQGKCTTFNGKQVCEKDGFEYVDVNGTKIPGYRLNSDAFKEVTCLIGNDFIVDIPRGMLFYADKNGKPSADNSQCIPGTQSVTSKGIASRQCVSEGLQAWKCYIIQCRKTANGEQCDVLSQPNGKESRKPLTIGDKIASITATLTDSEGGVVPTSEDVKKILSDENATPEQRAAAEKALTTFDAETQRGILGESQTSVNEKIAQQKNIRDGADTELSAIARGECRYSTTGSCTEESAAAAKRKADAEAEINRLNEQKDRLSKLQVVKQPQVIESENSSVADGNRERGLYGCDASSPLYRLCINSNQERERGQRLGYTTLGPAYSDYGAYSSSGDQRYCVVSQDPLIVHDYPARPGCLNYRSQSTMQQCGATNTGGLIGTIVSLFAKKNNSGSQNCVNGVPVPSCTIAASPTNVATGQSVTLTWQSQQAFSANLSSNGSVAPQGSMTVNPQTTTTYTLFLEGYIDNRTGQQLRGQCATQVVVGGQGGGDGAPKAEISCRPEVADVGMSVALSFACRNSTSSGGTGFSTNNQMSGSATPVVESPTLGTSVAKYALTCSKEGKTDTAECTVKINTTSIVLIANPKTVKSGGEANIGWITSGMESCRLWSSTLNQEWVGEDDNTANTSGVAKTPSLTEDAHFQLDCTTKSGGTKTAETTVTVD